MLGLLILAYGLAFLDPVLSISQLDKGIFKKLPRGKDKILGYKLSTLASPIHTQQNETSGEVN
jgi:hypothetical protein